MERIEINSNITIYYIPMTKLKTTAVGVYLHRPLRKEEVSLNALLPYVLKRGCALCRDSEAVSKYLEELYGASFSAGVMKMGDDQIIHLSFEAISDKYAPSGERIAEGVARLAMSALFEPAAFTDEIAAQEKKNALQRIMAEINEKVVYARRRCVEEMFGDEPFALSALGTAEGVDAVTADTLKSHYGRVIASSPIDIYVCGDTDIEAIAETVRKAVLNADFEAASLPVPRIITRESKIKRVTDHMDVVQGKLCIGFKTGITPDGKDYIPLMLMNSIYGGGAHSKLFNNVREKLSLCYYASSSLISTKGVMLVNAGIEFENFDKAYEEILAQLDAVKNGDITDAELQSAASSLINRLESNKDEQRLMQLFLLGQRVSGTGYDIDALKEAVSRVTKDDVMRAARGIELDTVYFLAGEDK